MYIDSKILYVRVYYSCRDGEETETNKKKREKEKREKSVLPFGTSGRPRRFGLQALGSARAQIAPVDRSSIGLAVVVAVTLTDTQSANRL